MGGGGEKGGLECSGCPKNRTKGSKIHVSAARISVTLACARRFGSKADCYRHTPCHPGDV